MNANVKKVLQYAVFLLIGIFLLWLSVKNIPSEHLTKTRKSFEHADYWIVFISILISNLAHVVRASRWNLLLKPIGYPVRFWNSFSAVMIGYMVNYALPRVGEISRCGIVSKYDGVPFATAVGTVILERILDLFCLLIVFAITLFLQFSELKTLTKEHIINPAKNLTLSISSNQALLVSLVLLMIACVFSIWIMRKKIRLFLKGKIGTAIKKLFDGLKSIWELKQPINFIFQSLLIWFLYFLGLYSCMFCLPETAVMSPAVSMSVLLFSTIGVIVSPGGMGAYQLISTAVLLYYGLDNGAAYAFPWIAWLSQLVGILLVGLICFISLPYFNKSEHAEN